MKYNFTESDREKIEKARKTNRDKQIENRLKLFKSIESLKDMAGEKLCQEADIPKKRVMRL